MPVYVQGAHFKDEYGRTLVLRGINLGGSSKVPFTPDGATYRRESFFAHRTVSFVGRPFPLAEADEHFARLRSWGFTLLRFLVTWEAVEHAGPGLYDQEYLEYLRAVVAKAGEHGLDLFIDPHQDVWSRFTGGDGAPGWTLEAAGFDLERLHETGAAFVHAVHGDPLPKMIWPTNAAKLAAATMFTLFFGGNDFAPATRVDGEPIQDFLQRHYLGAMQQVASILRDLPNVVGYDTLNEPQRGYIGCGDLRSGLGPLALGPSPTPWQGMLLGEGLPQEVAVWRIGRFGLRRAGTQVLNRTGARAWRDDRTCVWRQNGVWDFDASGAPRLLRPEHFARVDGRAVDFDRDYYQPFIGRFIETIRSAAPGAIVFVEPEVDRWPPAWSAGYAANAVFAPHWYDAYVLVKKEFSPFLAVDPRTRRVVFGPRAIRRSFRAQLAALKRAARSETGQVPVLLGEFGIPFDLGGKMAYLTGDFRAQVKALDRSFRAVEDNLLHCTLWNYTSDNTNARGDQWNDEDLSIFSRDQQADPRDIDSGGRALRAAVRPYPRATAGEPLAVSFDCRRRVFSFRFRHDPLVTAPTEIFVPDLQYPRGYRVEVSDGTYEILREEQMLIYRHGMERGEHSVRIGPL